MRRAIPSGTAGESLTLETDPTGLALNQLHEADVVPAASAARQAPIGRVSPDGDILAAFTFKTGLLGFWRVSDLTAPVFSAPATYSAVPLMAYLPDGRLLAVTSSNRESDKYTMVLFDENFNMQTQDFYARGTYFDTNIVVPGTWSLAAGGQCVLQVVSESFNCWPIPPRAPQR